jgi:hypothetical protein
MVRVMDRRLDAAKSFASTISHWDLWLSLALGAAAGLACTSKPVRAGSVTILIAETAIGGAFLAVVLSAIAVFVTFFDRAYRTVLMKAHDGKIEQALLPYGLVGVVAAVACVASLVFSILWPLFDATLGEFALGISTWLACWTIFGSASLVGLTIWHGAQRAQVMASVDQAREIRQRSLASPASRSRT